MTIAIPDDTHITRPRPDMPEAKCHGLTHLFFPTRGDGRTTREAKAICRTCPHIDACREWAMEQTMRLNGVWGGMSGLDRELAKRKAS